MVTKTEHHLAGAAALVPAASLTAGLLLFPGGPPTEHGGVIAAWFRSHAFGVRFGALAWLLTSVALVVLAVALREALWATMADRGWAAQLFVQGAVGSAAVVVVAAGVVWALATQARAESLTPEVAAALWSVARSILRFATWGLTVPLVVIGLILHRYSTPGQFGAVAGVLVAIGILIPVTWGPALYAFAAWLALVGVILIRPVNRHRIDREVVVRDESST